MEKIYAMVHHRLVRGNENTEKFDNFGVNEVTPYYSLIEVLTKLHDLYWETAYGSEEERCNNQDFEQTVSLEYGYDNIYPMVHRITKGPGGYRREDVYEVHALPVKE